MVPESRRGFVLCTNMSGSLFSSPRANITVLIILLLLLIAPRWAEGTVGLLQCKERTGGTGIDLALINHCTMIHEFCQTAGMIYGPACG